MFVKICGITRLQDALCAVEHGADAIGFIFAESKRKVSISTVQEIIQQLPKDFLTIGVFRDQPAHEVTEIVGQANLRGVQLHGQESIQEVAEVATKLDFVVKSVIAGSDEAKMADQFATDMILVDSETPGSGTSYDLNLLHELPVNVRLILSGGLTVDNVSMSIKAVSPWGVDVSSGVESAPGIKDHAKIRDFISNARSSIIRA